MLEETAKEQQSGWVCPRFLDAFLNDLRKYLKSSQIPRVGLMEWAFLMVKYKSFGIKVIKKATKYEFQSEPWPISRK